jgi:hypothetical protein
MMSGQDKKKREARRSEGQWRELLERHAASGMSVAVFCKAEGISPANLYRWGNLLKDTRMGRRVPAKDPTRAFIDAGVLEGSPRRSRLDLRLDLGDGWVMHLVRS